MKKIKKQYKKIRKELKRLLAENIEMEKPSLEDCLFAFLIIFSLTFSALLFGIGNQNENEKYPSENNASSRFEKRISSIVSDHPIQNMIPFIVQKDKKVAAYMIAIAKKESNWGKYSPQKDGRNCFNYWGYRGTFNQTDSGYSCFKNSRQAVNVVGSRIQELIDQDINTPQEMVVWKCGKDCSGHDTGAVEKWIQDVDLYYKKTSQLL